jgi:hypothetical protein
LVLGLALALSLAACRHREEGLAVVAPFDVRKELAYLTAQWTQSPEERAFAEGFRLKEPEVRFLFRVRAHNVMRDKLYVRLDTFQLVDAQGQELGRSTAQTACTLAAGETTEVLSGDVWVDRTRAAGVRDFRLARQGVPLNDLGRELMRTWLLQGRTGREAEVDAELERYAAAPACGSR